MAESDWTRKLSEGGLAAFEDRLREVGVYDLHTL